MHLDDRELDLLARFFAKRFPHAADRAALLVPAELEDSQADEPVAAWRDVLEQAQRQGALDRLARAARTDDPDDVNLREVRRLLIGAPAPRWNLVAAGLGAVAGLALVGLGGVAWALSGATATVGASPAGDRAPTVAAAPKSVPPVLASVREPEVPRPLPARVEPPVEVAAVPTPPVVPAVSNPRRPLTADHCARVGAEVSGYWYVGAEMPGAVGDVIVVPHDVYVRAEVPGAANGYDTRTEVRCVLYEGDRVRLSVKPVLVPADAWWVGTSGSDVVVAGGAPVR